MAQPLAEALIQEGLRVWFDAHILRLGDGLRRSIDQGLQASRYGIVILSPHFFTKEWPHRLSRSVRRCARRFATVASLITLDKEKSHARFKTDS